MWQASWGGEYPRNRGSNVIIVDPSSCTLQEWRHFDTHWQRDTAARLRDYLRGLSNGTVLVGVSCDAVSLFLSDALPTLSALGADVSDVEFRGAWVFVAEKGNASKTVLDKQLTEAAEANASQPRINVTFGKCGLRTILEAAHLSSHVHGCSLRIVYSLRRSYVVCLLVRSSVNRSDVLLCPGCN